ncbi:MAG: gliding motility protein GldL [Mariniphaga sp.]|nr:gliding motility protein GldL [Mariniphaga sp.]
MSIGEVFNTKRWKIIMGFVYGWGASIVMLGALFKLQHWQYGGLLLTVGLVTEAIIFFLSAFEPPMESYEWSKVYPELRDDAMLDTDISLPEKEGGLQQLLSAANLSPDLLDKVGKSLSDLTVAARGISDISSATVATDSFIRNMNSASESMNKLANINQQVNETVHASVDKMVKSYAFSSDQFSEVGKNAVDKLHKSSEEFSSKLSESGKKLAESVNSITFSMTSEFKNIGENSKMYSGNLEKLNQNIQALNQNFESQLKYAMAQFEANQKFNRDMAQMNETLASSASELKKYKDNAEQLNQHLESLNTIYGNMLGAMSYKK